MIYEKKFKLKGAILTQKNLTKLMDISSDYFPNTSVSIEFKDDSSQSSISATELKKISFQNKHINQIQIHGYCHEEGQNSSIWARIEPYFNTYEIKVEFNDYEKYIKFCDELNQWIIEVSDRKNYIKLLHSWVSLLCYFMILYIPSLSITKIFTHIFDRIMLSILIVFPLFGLSAIIYGCVKYAFPLTEIDIGINRRKTFRKFVWGILSLLVIPTILSIIL